MRLQIANVNSNEPLFYPYSIQVNKCSGSCNDIDDPYAKLCVHDIDKKINVKVFNLVSRTNETRYIEWYEAFKWKCRLDASVCNNKQQWIKDKCRCECKELIDKGICDKGLIWNPSNCDCECDKSCDVREYLDYEDCKCRKKIIDKLVKECSKNIDGNEMIHNGTLIDYGNICNSCTIYIVLFVITLLIIIGIVITNNYPNTETVIYFYLVIY